MIVSAWHDGHGSYGLRVLEADVSLWFRPEWTEVTLVVPDDHRPFVVPLTAGFWESAPELRSQRIKEFFSRNGLIPWEKQRPPCFELEPLGDGEFRVDWIERPRGQPPLPLGAEHG